MARGRLLRPLEGAPIGRHPRKSRPRGLDRLRRKTESLHWAVLPNGARFRNCPIALVSYTQRDLIEDGEWFIPPNRPIRAELGLPSDAFPAAVVTAKSLGEIHTPTARSGWSLPLLHGIALI